MANPTAAILVIGDEILSGRTRDSNMHYLAGALSSAGIDLREVRMIADEHEAITRALIDLKSRYDHVFTSGGIGPTHDDITADCIAAAFGSNIDIRADARDILERYYQRSGIALNAARLRMARIPEGATLIDNPVSGAPGFRLENVYVLAGVPAVFQAMVASILPTLTGGAPLVSKTRRILRGEGDIAGPLGTVAAAFPALSIGSYPFHAEGKYGAHVVVRGADVAQVDAALTELDAFFDET
ncbi:MAG: molybdopterin-binding protein [Pseudomonadota bacterium]